MFNDIGAKSSPVTIPYIYIVVIVVFPRGRGVVHDDNTSGHAGRHFNTEQRQRDIDVIGFHGA